jgi:dipeptidyl aminopeptidase/acylaminoacyl peptidase
VEDRDPHLFSVSLEGGEPQPITVGAGRRLPREEPGRDSYDISPDGAEIAFASDVDRTGVERNSDVFVIPAAGGEARNLTPENGADDGGPVYSPDGRWLAFERQVIKGFYADRVRVMLRDRKAGESRVLTEGWDRSARGLVWAGSAGPARGDRRRRHPARVPPGRAVGPASPLTRDRSFSGLALAQDGRTLVALRQSFAEPPTLVKVDLASGAASKLSSFNDALLAGVDFGAYESVTYKGARGEDVQMWVNCPPGFNRAKKWPVFVLLHGGPHNGVSDAWQPRWNAQVFSGWGYVTAWHNFHGSSGFGQASRPCRTAA